jgi:hypothetical protein
MESVNRASAIRLAWPRKETTRDRIGRIGRLLDEAPEDLPGSEELRLLTSLASMSGTPRRHEMGHMSQRSQTIRSSVEDWKQDYISVEQ